MELDFILLHKWAMSIVYDREPCEISMGISRVKMVLKVEEAHKSED